MPTLLPPTESEVCGTGATPNKGAAREAFRKWIKAYLNLFGTAGTLEGARATLGTYSTNEIDAKDKFKNRIVNGDFAVDQEFAGASVTVTAGAALKWVIDGWYAYCTGANVTFQTTTVAGRKRARFTGAASNTAVGFATRIEAADSADMANKFATLSALLSSSSITTVNWGLYYANATNTFGSVASPSRTSIQTGSFTITSTEAAYSAITSAALAAGATTGLELVFTVGALTAANTLTFGDAQLERGSVATPSFSPDAASVGLARCMRLWESDIFNYLTYQANTAGFSLRQLYKVPKRIAPASVPLTGVAYTNAVSGSASGISSTGVTIIAISSGLGPVQIACTWTADARLTA